MNIDKLKASYSLEGKVAIVTGASKPDGMGFATALKLGELGATVVITDLPEARPELVLAEGMTVGSSETLKTAVELLQAEDINAMGYPVDVTKPEQIKACVDSVAKEFGGIDILVNNAGIFIGVKQFYELSDLDWNLSWQVHVKGAMDFAKAVIPEMKKRGGGSIINNASIAALLGLDGYSAYGVTKGGNVLLAKNLAAEFGKDNIRVNAVSPGNVRTGVTDGELQMLCEEHNITQEEAEAMVNEPVALGRYASVGDVAEAIAFLATPAASYISGVELPVTGAITAGIA